MLLPQENAKNLNQIGLPGFASNLQEQPVQQCFQRDRLKPTVPIGTALPKSCPSNQVVHLGRAMSDRLGIGQWGILFEMI